MYAHTHAQTRKYKNLRELERQTFYYQHNEHLPTLTWQPLLQELSMPGQRTSTCGETGQSLWYTTGCHCTRTKNTYLQGHKVVSAVDYRLSLSYDNEHLPAMTQGSLCSRLQAVTVIGQ